MASSSAKTKVKVETHQGIRILLGCTEVDAEGKAKPNDEQTMVWPALLSKNATLKGGDHVWVFDPEEEEDSKKAQRLPFIGKVCATWGTTFMYLPCRSKKVWELKKYKLNDIILGLSEVGKPIPQSALNATWQTHDMGTTGHRDVYLLNFKFLKKKEDFSDVADFFEKKLNIEALPVSESILEVATNEFIKAFVGATEEYVCDDLDAAEEAYKQRVKPFAVAHAREYDWQGTARIVNYNKRECRIARWEDDAAAVDSDATLSVEEAEEAEEEEEEDVSDVDARDVRTLLAAGNLTPQKKKRKSPPLSSPPRSQKKSKSRQSIDEEMETLQNVANTIMKHASLREKVESELADEKKKVAALAAELDAEKKQAAEQKKQAAAEKKKVAALSIELDAEKKKAADATAAAAAGQQSGPVTAFGKILGSLLFTTSWDEATTFLHLSHIIRDTAVDSFICTHSQEKAVEYVTDLLVNQDVKSVLKAFLVDYSESFGETALRHWETLKPKLDETYEPKLSGNERVQDVYKRVLANMEVPE
jgi:hypothetical protein